MAERSGPSPQPLNPRPERRTSGYGDAQRRALRSTEPRTAAGGSWEAATRGAALGDGHRRIALGWERGEAAASAPPVRCLTIQVRFGAHIERGGCSRAANTSGYRERCARLGAGMQRGAPAPPRGANRSASRAPPPRPQVSGDKRTITHCPSPRSLPARIQNDQEEGGHAAPRSGPCPRPPPHPALPQAGSGSCPGLRGSRPCGTSQRCSRTAARRSPPTPQPALLCPSLRPHPRAVPAFPPHPPHAALPRGNAAQPPPRSPVPQGQQQVAGGGYSRSAPPSSPTLPRVRTDPGCHGHPRTTPLSAIHSDLGDARGPHAPQIPTGKGPPAPPAPSHLPHRPRAFLPTDGPLLSPTDDPAAAAALWKAKAARSFRGPPPPPQRNLEGSTAAYARPTRGGTPGMSPPLPPPPSRTHRRGAPSRLSAEPPRAAIRRAAAAAELAGENACHGNPRRAGPAGGGAALRWRPAPSAA